MGAREAGSTLRADPAGRQHQQDEMPETQMPDTKLKWTRVAPMKWRKVAPAATVVADDAADQSAKRARTLTLNNKTVADFKNWLDFLAHMDHDAYITLMRYMVGTGVIEHRDWAAAGNTVIKGANLMTVLFCRLNHCYDINIYGLQYTTYNKDNSYSHSSIAHVHIRDWDKDHMDKKKLLAAAEANGIKVSKGWTKPRLWKALLSA
jgi:hypothetical protein